VFVLLDTNSRSIAAPTYSKEAALLQDKQMGLKLLRVGEAIQTTNKTWFINDERVCSLLLLIIM